MSKYLIFLLFSVSTFSKQFTENDYLNDILKYASNTNPNIIDKYKEFFPLNEKKSYLTIPSLEDQIGRKSGFDKKDYDELIFKEFDDVNKAKQDIIEYIAKKSIRKTNSNDTADYFVKNMNYNYKQWTKYDLLVSKSKEISTLSVFTKKVVTKFVNVYFITIKRLKNRYTDFILINKSENEDNPFNSFYSIELYLNIYKTLITKQFKFTTIPKGNDIHNYKNVLVQYYSILSYSAIADKVKYNKFKVPFDNF